MWLILASLLIGILIGIFSFIPSKYMRYNLRFQQAGIILLLFSMGASIGANKELINNLKYIGLKSATFAAATSMLSILTVYFISLRLFTEDERK